MHPSVDGGGASILTMVRNIDCDVAGDVFEFCRSLEGGHKEKVELWLIGTFRRENRKNYGWKRKVFGVAGRLSVFE